MGQSFGILDSPVNSLVFHPPTRPGIEKLKEGATSLYISKSPTDSKARAGPVVVFSHGNAYDLEDSEEFLEKLAKTCKCAVVGYDPPGYGKTPGNPSESGWVKSLSSVVKYLMVEHGYSKDKIILAGHSLGTSPTVQVAANLGLTSPIILIAPFMSISRVALNSSIVSSVANSVTQTTFNTDKFVPLVRGPVCIVHGTSDDLIDVAHGKEMATLVTNSSLGHYWLQGVGHNDILDRMPARVWTNAVGFVTKQTQN